LPERRRLSTVNKESNSDSSLTGEAEEHLLGWAVRARDNKEFRSRISTVVGNNRESRRKLARGGVSSRSKVLRYQAIDAYLQSWLARRLATRKRLLEKSWNYCKKALDEFRKGKDPEAYGWTYAELSVAPALFYGMNWNPRARERTLREAVEFGRIAVRILSRSENRSLYARVCVRTALFLDNLTGEGFDVQFQEEINAEARDLWNKASKADRRSAVLETARPPAGFYSVIEFQESASFWEEALGFSRQTGDNLAIGWLCDQLSGHAFWQAQASEEPDKAIELSEQSLTRAEEAGKRLSIFRLSGPDPGVLWSGSPYAEHFMQMSWFVEDADQRQLFVEKAYHKTRDLIEKAQRSGNSKVEAYSHHIASKTSDEMARYAPSPGLRRYYLQKALAHRELAFRILETAQPGVYWSRGVYLRYMSDIKARLSDYEPSRAGSIDLLRKAVEDKAAGLALSEKFVNAIAKSRTHVLFSPLGGYKIEYGNLLTSLYILGGEEESFAKAAAAYASAGDILQKTKRYGRTAEAYWKAAEVYDGLANYSFASNFFKQASKRYLIASQKLPHLAGFYREYANYFLAWSKIELARAAHARFDYMKASGFYEEAAITLKKAGKLAVLSDRYIGFAKMEAAEETSRRGFPDEAKKIFDEAARLFIESNKPLRTRGSQQEWWPAERSSIEQLAATPRGEYCRARALIEDARIADKHGDHAAGSEKFGQASKILFEASNRSILPQDRMELAFIATLSEGWQLMENAAGKVASRPFSFAAELFQKASEMDLGEMAGLLARGHREFCKGLGEVNSFLENMDPAGYESAAKHLGLAWNNFSKAGFSLASGQTRAYKLLLDAHAEIGRGDKSPDRISRASHYRAGRTLLHEAVAVFDSLGQVDKRDQVERLLKESESEWKLSSDLAELWKSGSQIAETVAFPVPSHLGEKLVGTSRLEAPDIEARLTTAKGPSDSPTTLRVEIEVSNTGSQPIRLGRLEGVVPDGVRLAETGNGRLVDGGIVLNPRRIDPAKSETVTFILEYRAKDSLLLANPRIMFIDPDGKEHWRVLDPRVLAASPILEYLSKEFRRDYKSKRLGLEYCGWRTLMDVVESLNVPRSNVYGEPRYGRKHGRQLGTLISAEMVESRVFQRERGRGGSIEKIRVVPDNPAIKELMSRS